MGVVSALLLLSPLVIASAPWGRCSVTTVPFIDGQVEAEWGQVTCLKSQLLNGGATTWTETCLIPGPGHPQRGLLGKTRCFILAPFLLCGLRFWNCEWGGATELPKPPCDGLSSISQNSCLLSAGDLIRKWGLCRCDQMH